DQPRAHFDRHLHLPPNASALECARCAIRFKAVEEALLLAASPLVLSTYFHGSSLPRITARRKTPRTVLYGCAAPFFMVDQTTEESWRTASRTNPEDSASPETAAVSFEKLLADLSTVFVRASVDEIDDEIERWLERIVLAMGVDRSTVVQLDPQDGLLYITHQWAREGVSALQRSRTPPPHEFSWLVDKVNSGQVLVISRVDDLPPEASIVREA